MMMMVADPPCTPLYNDAAAAAALATRASGLFLGIFAGPSTVRFVPKETSLSSFACSTYKKEAHFNNLETPPSTQQPLEIMSAKLFVGGLSWSTDDNSLRAAFEAHGEVLEGGALPLDLAASLLTLSRVCAFSSPSGARP